MVAEHLSKQIHKIISLRGKQTLLLSSPFFGNKIPVISITKNLNIRTDIYSDNSKRATNKQSRQKLNQQTTIEQRKYVNKTPTLNPIKLSREAYRNWYFIVDAITDLLNRNMLVFDPRSIKFAKLNYCSRKN